MLPVCLASLARTMFSGLTNIIAGIPDRLDSISWYRYSTFYLSVHQLMHTFGCFHTPATNGAVNVHVHVSLWTNALGSPART